MIGEECHADTYSDTRQLFALIAPLSAWHAISSRFSLPSGNIKRKPVCIFFYFKGEAVLFIFHEIIRAAGYHDAVLPVGHDNIIGGALFTVNPIGT